MTKYAAKLENDKVTQVIVGEVEWAESRLGGTWISSDTKVGIGWELYEEGLRPPSPYPSWSWSGTTWEPPIPQPESTDESSYYVWNEEAQSWDQESLGEI